MAERAIHAIPTKYAGVQFRSRLEARWAAFWDICGIKWKYEPIDLNGYIPDFIVRLAPPTGGWNIEDTGCEWWDSVGRSYRGPSSLDQCAWRDGTVGDSDTLVEVKPLLKVADAREACMKIDKTTWDGFALVVGTDPFIYARRYWMRHGAECQRYVAWMLAGAKGSPVADPDASWREVWWWRGPSKDEEYPDTASRELPMDDLGGGVDVVEAWAEAGNIVQWKPKARRP